MLSFLRTGSSPLHPLLEMQILIAEGKKMGHYGQTTSLIKQPVTKSQEVSGPGAGPRVATKSYRPSLHIFKDKSVTKGTHWSWPWLWAGSTNGAVERCPSMFQALEVSKFSKETDNP